MNVNTKLTTSLIDGVVVKKLVVHTDKRGRLMEILRSDDQSFQKFGQVYMTTAYPGVVKAWHYHKKQTDHFSCINGMIKLALYDPRDGSYTNGFLNEFFLGIHNPLVVRIPKGVYHGFKCVDSAEAIVINVPDVPYDTDNPDEYRLHMDDQQIGYDWSRKDE